MKVRVRIQRPARFRILLLNDSKVKQSSPVRERMKVLKQRPARFRILFLSFAK